MAGIRATITAMRSYSQYCPVSVASEVLGDRWTMLIVREMIGGATRFNELERCLPRISRSLLVQRLRQLARVGVVEAVPSANGRGNEYRLTPAGKELEPVLMAMGEWAVRWFFGDPTPDQLDPTFLMWWMHRRVNLDELPPGRTVVRFDIISSKRNVYWLVLERDGCSVCMKDPGFEVDVHVVADSFEFHRVFAGRVALLDAVRDGKVTIEGPSQLVRRLPAWFAWSPFHDMARAMLSEP